MEQVYYTYFYLLLQIIIVLYFFYELNKLRKLSVLVEEAEADNGLACIAAFERLEKSYKATINIATMTGRKSNVSAAEYYSEQSVCRAGKINLKMLDAVSSILVGLGLLGTFLGLTLGIIDFDSSNTDNIKKSIQLLLGGMGMAFSTSLVGMFFSLFYTFFLKRYRNKLEGSLRCYIEKLDSKYYINDIELMAYNQQKSIEGLKSEIKKILTYDRTDGVEVTIGNAIREILIESMEQTKALKAFSTDLAIELNNGFDEALSRQMQQKILPLMENVDLTTKTIIEHIDKMAELVSAPAADMMQSVVDELKSSMLSITKEFNAGLSGSATSELENLALQLGTATQAMSDLPRNMSMLSDSLQVTIDDVKLAVAEISRTSVNASSVAMQQMHEQITFAVGAIGEAIAGVKNVMEGITQSSQKQSSDMVNSLSSAADKMSEFLDSTISVFAESVKESMMGVTDDVRKNQTDLILLQENTIEQTKKLLESFNVGLERLAIMNETVQSTMNMFQLAQGHISGSTAHLQTITDNMKTATQLFSKGQTDYSLKMEELQKNSQSNIDLLLKMFTDAGNMSLDYAQKFEMIKSGLSLIFEQIQEGLSEYSRTVQSSTQKYLDLYSTSLTNTTDALSSTIQQQNEIVEMLVDSLNSRKS